MLIKRIFERSNDGSGNYIEPGIGLTVAKTSSCDWRSLFLALMYGRTSAHSSDGGLLVDHNGKQIVISLSKGQNIASVLAAETRAPCAEFIGISAGKKIFGLTEKALALLMSPCKLELPKPTSVAAIPESVKREYAEARAAILRDGRMLNRSYYALAAEKCSAAKDAQINRIDSPLELLRKKDGADAVAADIEKARRLSATHTGKAKLIIAAILLFLGLIALVLPINPFMAKLPLFGVFACAAGIIFVLAMLSIFKYREAKTALNSILEFYGVLSPDEIQAQASRIINRPPPMSITEKEAIAFLSLAFPGIKEAPDYDELLKYLSEQITRFERAEVAMGSALPTASRPPQALISSEFAQLCSDPVFSGSMSLLLKQRTADLFCLCIDNISGNDMNSCIKRVLDGSTYPSDTNSITLSQHSALAICLRLAAYELAGRASGMAPPIVLFGGTSALDDIVLRSILRLLRALSEKTQIILFTDSGKESTYISGKTNCTIVDCGKSSPSKN